MDSLKSNPGPEATFSLLEVTELLVKHQGLHEGIYNLSFEFQLAFGAVGPTPEQACPGAMLGISRMGLSKVDKKNIHSVDAAIVNPAKKTVKPVKTPRIKK